MNTHNLLGTRVSPETTDNILEKIRKYIAAPSGFFHIVSINPENIMESRANMEFKKVVETAQVQIMDGAGILWASKLLFDIEIERLHGVDLMDTVVKKSSKERRR